MNNETLKMIQTQIGYHFKNTNLLKQAFIRRSYSKENGGEDNEVLEFIGDKALDLIVVKILTKKYGSFANEGSNEFISEYSEGKLTEIKKKLVCKEMLANRIRMFGFQYLLVMSKSDEEQNIQEKESVQEDLFEAIIGAVALDSNWNLEKIENVIDLLLDVDFYLENGFDNKENYVELLQQWSQKKFGIIPVYVFIYDDLFIDGVHKKWTCCVGLHPIDICFEGVGATKSEARMCAAKEAYNHLKNHNLLFNWVDEVGKPEFDRAINQLQELYQKEYIDEPRYDFSESYDNNGNPVWLCQCRVGDNEYISEGSFTSKKHGKKSVAYDMLCFILNWEDKNNEA